MPNLPARFAALILTFAPLFVQRSWCHVQVLLIGAILVADSSFSSLLFLYALGRHGLTVITRLRLDAALYDPAPPRAPGTMGRPRKAGQRLATLAKVAADAATVWQSRRATPAFALWNDQFAITNQFRFDAGPRATMRVPLLGEMRLHEAVPGVGGILGTSGPSAGGAELRL